MCNPKAESNKARLPWQCITSKEKRMREEGLAAYKPISPCLKHKKYKSNSIGCKI